MGKVDLKKFEVYSQERIAPLNYIVIRNDGNGFHTHTKEAGYEKPFDSKMKDYMVQVTKQLMEKTGAFMGYTESDEISIVLDKDSEYFSRRRGKLESITASACASQYSLLTGAFVCFDGKVMPLPNEDVVIDYMQDRQMDAFKNCIGTYLYWMHRKKGIGATKASKIMLNIAGEDRADILEKEYGITIDKIPLWQRRGTLLYREVYEKEGFNPKKGKAVYTTRKRIMINEELPIFVKQDKMYWASIFNPVMFEVDSDLKNKSKEMRG